ncbi:MAG: hypothetical protein R3Y22_07270 [Bacteroidales bacterium]
MRKNIILAILLAITVIANAKQYKVGDIYNNNGIKGIVVIVTNNGEHGLIMSLDGEAAHWSEKNMNHEIKAFHEDDGMKNMLVVENYINENGISWDNFPLFKWARDMGDGWYIPAKDETLTIMENINGGSLIYNEKNIKGFEKKIKKGKGRVLRNKGAIGDNSFLDIVTSTEITDDMSYRITMSESDESTLGRVAFGKFSSQKGTFQAIPVQKNIKLKSRSRAVHKF